MVIITLNEYAKERDASESAKGGGVCLTWARTSQTRTALKWAVLNDRTACVQALVAAKAALDIKDVSDARLFACPVTFESPSTSKSR